MTRRIIYPPVADFNRLRQPLTSGERRVFDLFNKHLPDDWEIYIQPHLNGLRPDFVLLNPKVGIGVFEVKDWDLNAMTYRNEGSVLRASHEGQTFDVWPNPVQQLRRYKEEIHQLYCPRLERSSA